MELLKLGERPAEFKWKDVTFFFRTKVTVGDKYEIDTAGTLIAGDKVSFTPWNFYLTITRIFVTGWDGVTEDGKAVPYSHENMLTRLPAQDSEDLIMKLGVHIAQNNGLISSDKKEEDGVKNV
jgi:hypothetical protein